MAGRVFSFPASGTVAGAIFVALVAALVCGGATSFARASGPTSYGEDSAFVKQLMPSVVELSDDTGDARVLVSPSLQGRVLTSTAAGEDGAGFGWINKELFASKKLGPHMNAFGGEDRFWMGPEGGQFSFFFAPKAAFTLNNWQTPAVVDTEPFDVVGQDRGQITFKRDCTLTNYSGTKFQIHIDRQVKLIGPAEAWNDLAIKPVLGVKLVAFESDNHITNAGAEAWSKSTGLVSIWILGQFNASPDAVVVVPFKKGSEAELGRQVESDYFGKVPADRLQVKDGVVYFRADAHYRSKIGISPRRAIAVLGSYDSVKELLTLVQYTLPGTTQYVNSQWKIQDDPFSGDVVNSYNDGPNALGTSLGNFYEMESSSQAEELAPGQSVEHVHRTLHLIGQQAALDRVAYAVLGIHLGDIATNLPAPAK